MSKVEDSIQAEREAAARKAASKAKAEENRQAKKWATWVEQEKPRIAVFRRKINKLFPCLKGDFEVEPRDYIGDPFTAKVSVKGKELEIRQDEGEFTLFVPFETNTITGWKTDYNEHVLKSDKDLKTCIATFIREREYQEERARAYYDSFPIGNTD